MSANASLAGLYKRADSPYWWLWVRVLGDDGQPVLDAKGKPKRKPVSTGVPLEDTEKAQALLAQIIRQQGMKKTLGVRTGPVTLGEYGKKWLAKRRAAGMAAVFGEESCWRVHVAPHPIAKLPMADVRVRHIRELVETLERTPSRKGGMLSPRTIHNIYGMLHTIFGDAVAEELLDASPATLTTRRRQLPTVVDKDPAWRAQAVFTRTEVETLVSDERIPEYRRVLYAVLFMTGARFGEAVDRRVGDYDPTMEPLGRLLMATSYSGRMRKSKRRKTKATAEVPVHPTLATVLAEWLVGGWERMAGRAPQPGDLLLPSLTMERQKNRAALDDFHADLELLGFRRRRLHDARRTFITLTLADGASKDLLRWVTHGPSRDTMSQYESPPWDALSREVAKLRISLRGPGSVTPLLRVVNGGGNSNDDGELPAPIEEAEWGRRLSHLAGLVQSRAVSPEKISVSAHGSPVSSGSARAQRSNVAPRRKPAGPGVA